MKKFKFLLFIALLSFSLAGCSKSVQKTGTAVKTTSSSATKKEEISDSIFTSRKEAEKYFNLVFSEENKKEYKVPNNFDGADWENSKVIDKGKDTLTIQLGDPNGNPKAENSMNWLGVVKFTKKDTQMELNVFYYSSSLLSDTLGMTDKEVEEFHKNNKKELDYPDGYSDTIVVDNTTKNILKSSSYSLFSDLKEEKKVENAQSSVFNTPEEAMKYCKTVFEKNREVSSANFPHYILHYDFAKAEILAKSKDSITMKFKSENENGDTTIRLKNDGETTEIRYFTDYASESTENTQYDVNYTRLVFSNKTNDVLISEDVYYTDEKNPVI